MTQERSAEAQGGPAAALKHGLDHLVEIDRPPALAQAEDERLPAQHSVPRSAHIIDVKVARFEDEHRRPVIVRDLAADVEQASRPADVERQRPDPALRRRHSEIEQVGARIAPDLLGMVVVGRPGDEELHG
jgi:hypothetical protein